MQVSPSAAIDVDPIKSAASAIKKKFESFTESSFFGKSLIVSISRDSNDGARNLFTLLNNIQMNRNKCLANVWYIVLQTA